MKTGAIIFIAVFFLFAGCSKENELKNSVMIFDEEYTDLPAYSEWGYNTFGAYYDRQVFISNYETVPAKVIVTNNEMSFLLEGMNETLYENDGYADMSITFKMPGFMPENYSDLLVLDDTIFDLTNPAYELIVSIDTIDYTADILDGEFNFKRAQNLLVDNKQIEVILSGYFEFKALIGGKPVTVSNGRFDVGIGNDNFYKIILL
jgi:hypothetical protein